jgi:diketogulonate reductase-like aldo/keto reductase
VFLTTKIWNDAQGYEAATAALIKAWNGWVWATLTCC